MIGHLLDTMIVASSDNKPPSIETLMKVWENSRNAVEPLACELMHAQHFSFFQIYTHVSIINSTETWYMFSISQLGAIYAKDLLAWKDKFTLETRTHSSAILFLQAF